MPLNFGDRSRTCGKRRMAVLGSPSSLPWASHHDTWTLPVNAVTRPITDNEQCNALYRSRLTQLTKRMPETSYFCSEYIQQLVTCLIVCSFHFSFVSLLASLSFFLSLLYLYFLLSSPFLLFIIFCYFIIKQMERE